MLVLRARAAAAGTNARERVRGRNSIRTRWNLRACTTFPRHREARQRKRLRLSSTG